MNTQCETCETVFVKQLNSQETHDIYNIFKNTVCRNSHVFKSLRNFQGIYVNLISIINVNTCSGHNTTELQQWVAKNPDHAIALPEKPNRPMLWLWKQQTIVGYVDYRRRVQTTPIMFNLNSNKQHDKSCVPTIAISHVLYRSPMLHDGHILSTS